ncbi:SDR family NAD(P)-dependent oxidoreductase [Cytobacillus oceanisediminis]|uniref:SDR family NAD(P)-dependent oxidoreductase n=1 Tax=Cytobacillus oceanisediminis TaxID=665099 RepID=UPI002493FC64|nr:SDR family NAD(P)-dependent oxidoreductase [Cytobacillus oceanisediminis]
MKKVIVLGATGGTGTAIVEELINRGIQTIAFGRSISKLNQLKQKLGNSDVLTLQVGNAFDDMSIYEASKDVDVIFQCVAVPYREMEKSQITLGKAIMSAADKLGKKIVFVDGIYPYGKATKKFVDEDHSKKPHTKKGKIKLELENLIFSDQWKNAIPLIVRLPDYYGPSSNLNSYLGMTILNISKGKISSYIGSLNIPREYIYLPDAAKMIVELAGNSNAYRQNWNIPGNIITGKRLVQIAQDSAGQKKPVIPLKKTTIKMMGWFSPIMREMVEMSYLTEIPIFLDGSKYKQQIGPLIQTPFEVGIPHAIRALSNI